MKNMFLGKSVPPSCFIGREDVIEDIKNVVYAGRSTELVGPHRTGKSALCRCLCDGLEKEGKLIPYFIDLQHLPNPRFRSVVNAITNASLDRDYALPDDGLGNDQEAVNMLINFVNKKEKSLVIFLDEMDIGSTNKGYFTEWNSCLRSLSSEIFQQSDYDISIVKVFSSDPSRYGDIHQSFAISQAIGRDRMVRMKPITEDQAIDLYRAISENEKVASEFIIKYAGTFPLLIEIISFEVNKVSSEQVNYTDLLHNTYEQSEAFYTDLYNYIESIDNPNSTLMTILFSLAFQHIVNTNDEIKPAEPLKFNLNDYESRQLVSLGVITLRGGNKVIFSPLFSWWLSRKAVFGTPNEKSKLKHIAELLGVKNAKDLVGLVKASMSTGTGLATLLI